MSFWYYSIGAIESTSLGSHWSDYFRCFRVLELEESLGSMHLLEQNIKQKDGKVSSLNQVIQEREEKLAELENRLDPPLSWLWISFGKFTIEFKLKMFENVLDNIFTFVTYCLGCRNQGPLVWRLISANPGLNFNPGSFFFCLKAFSRIIFSILFWRIQSSNCRRKELNWIFSSSFHIWI